VPVSGNTTADSHLGRAQEDTNEFFDFVEIECVEHSDGRGRSRVVMKKDEGTHHKDHCGGWGCAWTMQQEADHL
jgi:hypothetical protein